MKPFKLSAALLVLFNTLQAWPQDLSAIYTWQASATKLDRNSFELRFSTKGQPFYYLYAPNQVLDGFEPVALQLNDNSILEKPLKDSGKIISWSNHLFENQLTKGFVQPTTWKTIIRFPGAVPALLAGTLFYTFGNDKELYPKIPFPFNLSLGRGITYKARIKIPSINSSNPLVSDSDEVASNKGLWTVFLLGLGGGFLALLTPCVFPMIPLTVSFFTKREAASGKGWGRAAVYALSIIGVYALLSLPFHFLDHLDPGILNNISTNVYCNLAFFALFALFAFSFFGFYDIRLPALLANRLQVHRSTGFLSILFMALTLALVSFSCTGPILGSLLAGAVTANGGALRLSLGMTGFGLGLALPFFSFALFPNALKALPKSGSWLTTLKVILGFVELALAVKFLSNADLVSQWGILKRETFLGIWIVIALLIIAYLAGLLSFPNDGTKKQRLSKLRVMSITPFAALILYLLPGLFNTRKANLSLISGFPPPVCYSLYPNPEACLDRVRPLRDYEEALALARKTNKPLLIAFTGWTCVNCRRMEESVWTDPAVKQLMQNSFIVVSLYVDDRQKLPLEQQQPYKTTTGTIKQLKTIGDKWATFQAENFGSVQQPQYAILSPDEKLVTAPQSYTPKPAVFEKWLLRGLK